MGFLPVLNKTSRTPTSNLFPQALPWQLARVRHPYGTWRHLLTAASSRTWRGSQSFIA